ncbi:hypothetical protein [Gillisia sp. Hel_I_29]|uniref:hypothetical protein n=1 Tax=Gillisia sp. Hel_I_29 TaxID=1249975 RepID=UPI0005543CD9|nr:hypothetical protein [Gillisia sp. Hel_I_29]
MKLIISILFFVLTSGSLFSQKNSTRIFDAKDLQQLHINTDEIFKIHISTSSTDKVSVTTHATGEYYNDIALSIKMEGTKMMITSVFNEDLQGGFDKLSAHKVFSLEMSIEIPENIQVHIRSNIASVIGSGSFKSLELELQSGYCKLDPFQGNAVINTYKGSIYLATNNANIDAETRNGMLEIPMPLLGYHQIKLSSIDGDIRVVKN